MPNTDFARKNQYDYLYDAIVNKYPGLGITDNVTAFQFLQEPMTADWVTGEDAAALAIADSVPARLGGFYMPGSSTVSSAYRSLIKSLQDALGDRNSNFRSLQIKIQTASDNLQKVIHDAQGEYNKYVFAMQQKGETVSSLEDWMQSSMAATPFKMKYDQVIEEYRRLSTEAERTYGSMGAALVEAKENLDKDQILLRSDGKEAVYIPRTTVGGNLAEDMRRWENSDGYEFDVTIKASDRDITPWKTVSTTEVKQSCHSTKIDSKIKVSQLIMDNDYSLNVKAVGLRAYPISRGVWYNDTFVNPHAEIVEGGQLDTESFFGDAGSLHMIPTSILVIYKPEISLTVSTQCYENYLANNTNLDMKYISLFSMNFDLQASLGINVKQGGSVSTITLVSPKETPAQILGISSTVKYSGFTGW
jgi:hypothetical protein